MSKAVESDEGDDYEDDEFDDFSGDNEEESPVVKNTDVSSIVEISPHFFVCQIADLKRNMAEDNKAALAKSKSAEKKIESHCCTFRQASCCLFKYANNKFVLDLS
jgi:hypothetical protein